MVAIWQKVLKTIVEYYFITKHNSLEITKGNIMWKNTVFDDTDSEESKSKDILEITEEFISFTCLF